MKAAELLPDVTNQYISLIPNCYLLVTWPDCQEYMDCNWFESEAILEVEGRFGGSAYFIPINRILNINDL